jgi:hypothetical protein
MKFRIHSKTGRSFRRNGIVFTGEPRVVDAAELGWTTAQVAELMSTDTLHVDRLENLPPVEETTPSKGRAKG